MSLIISLTPGFSPVTDDRAGWNRFNGFAHFGKPLKRLGSHNALATRLKPGVNQSGQ
jgi:hypothetical protein